MSTRLLFVCTGNTCRSPLAEALAAARGVTAESAGVDAEVGDGAAPNAERALRDARGLSLRDHEPRDVSKVQQLSEFEWIVAMSPAVARELREKHNVDPGMLIVWAVPDPYGGSLADYRWCLEQISTALDDVLSKE